MSNHAITLLNRKSPALQSYLALLAIVASLAFASQSLAWQSGSRSSSAGSLPAVTPTSPTPAIAPAFDPANSFSQPNAGLPGGSSVVVDPAIVDPVVVDPVIVGPTDFQNPTNLWSIHQPGSVITVDHSAWDYFLQKYVVTDSVGLNRVCYGSVTSNDRQLLQNYLCALAATDVRTLDRSEQLAYWLNFYNAQTVETILANYPVRSIRQIKMNLLDVLGPFNDQVVTVLGQSLSLSDIENNIVRANWQDPRIHYALNCASYGCPNLKKTAWRSWSLDADLTQAACTFINSGRAIKVGPLGWHVRASKIYKWYKEDFGGNDAAVLAHIRQYANADLAAKLSTSRSIGSYFYDWSLNDARITRPRLLEPLIR